MAFLGYCNNPANGTGGSTGTIFIGALDGAGHNILINLHDSGSFDQCLQSGGSSGGYVATGGACSGGSSEWGYSIIF